jgi:hypothetical protein
LHQQSIDPLFEVETSPIGARKGPGREAMHSYGNSKNPDFPVDREAFEKDKDRY